MATTAKEEQVLRMPSLHPTLLHPSPSAPPPPPPWLQTPPLSLHLHQAAEEARTVFPPQPPLLQLPRLFRTPLVALLVALLVLLPPLPPLLPSPPFR
jgi:hypothetical protein